MSRLKLVSPAVRRGPGAGPAQGQLAHPGRVADGNAVPADGNDREAAGLQAVGGCPAQRGLDEPGVEERRGLGPGQNGGHVGDDLSRPGWLSLTSLVRALLSA